MMRKDSVAWPVWIACLVAGLAAGFLAACGEGDHGDEEGKGAGRQYVIVVSPHPDDETIMAGGMLFRSAHGGDTLIDAIYLTSGDASGLPGPCWEESEEAKRRRIVEMREEETRRAWAVLGLAPSHLHFLRYPDLGLVEDSWFAGGRRVDVLSEAGEQAVADTVDQVRRLVPEGTARLTLVTTSFWDGHPDHRTAYQAARAAGEAMSRQRGIPVRLLHAVVHDEVPFDAPFCCFGDLHWPNPGPRLDHSALSDFPERPRPPPWDVIYDVSDLVGVRARALREHRSQVEGCPELCIFPFLILKSFYGNWSAKTEEAFYQEDLSPGSESDS